MTKAGKTYYDEPLSLILNEAQPVPSPMRFYFGKPFFLSLLAGLVFCVIDAFIDAYFFSHVSFLDSLILNVSYHETYFRAFFLLGFIVFGMVISRAFARRKLIQEDLQIAVKKVREEKARSEAIISAIGDGISIQAPDMTILHQNTVHKAMAGGDKTGLKCYQAYANSDRLCDGCPVFLSLQDGGIHSLEKTVGQGASKRHIDIKSSPLKDESGAIIAGIEAVRDITERKNALEKLHLFSAAIDMAMDGIQIVDLDGRILYSNKAVENIYGFSPEEFAGKHVNDMNADKDFASRTIMPQITDFGRWSGEVSVLHKNGTTFPVWLSCSMVKDESGTPVAMIGIIRDITERKQAEDILKRHHGHLVKLVEERTGELTEANQKLLKEIADREKMEEELLKAQKLESLGILAGGIAHDFNNLLAAMLGNITLAMLDLDETHPAYRQLFAAEKASLRAQDLTRQLLTFSKGGAPVKTATDIVELVKEAAGFAARGSRVRCVINVSGGGLRADVDEGQISQVIHNLIINADHAMPGGGTIEVLCSNEDLEENSGLPLTTGRYVVISVQDHGVGIPREHLSKIFDPYFTTKQKGSGLGLATCYAVIRKHRGHITVESRLGFGTLFKVYLPALPEKAVLPRKEEVVVCGGTGSILVMDDEADVRETTGNILTRLGYTVEFAVNGEEAINRYRLAEYAGKRYDLVIMDLTVPGGMGGKETIQKLMEIDPGVKAIVSSGYSNDPIMADFKKYGFCGVVAKPYRVKDLSQEVHKVLSNGK